MKKLLFILTLLLPVCAPAQTVQGEVPSGWKAIPLPVLGYNTDLGFQFGATADIYDYGKDPSLYPEYRHKFRAEVTQFTKGETTANLSYDSAYLIPGVRFTTALTAKISPLYAFYGFGGDITEYDRSIDKKDGMAFYNYSRRFFRFKANFQGEIARGFMWVGGLSAWYFKNDELNFANYDYKQTLFHYYIANGIIRENEIKGGVLELKAGLSYDTRDQEASPLRGIWAEAYAVGSPDAFSTGYRYLKLCLHFRHYFTPFKNADWLTFAYHLAYQGTIAGEAPYYMQQNIYSLVHKQSFNEGLGGLNTVRGLLNARLVGDGYAWANFEARFRILRFRWLSTDWSFGINPFFDMGMITKPMRLEELSVAYSKSIDELRDLATRIHKSAGIGFKLGLDTNYIMSLEIAKPFSSNDGPFALMTSVNYIF